MVDNFFILAGCIFLFVIIRGMVLMYRKNKKIEDKAPEKKFWITDSGLEALENRFDGITFVLMDKDNEVLQFIRGNGKSLEDLANGFLYIPYIHESMYETLQYLLEKKFIETK